MENVDFRQDLRMWAVNELKRYGVRYKEKDNLQMLLVKLYTFLEKYIAPYKRTVQLSNELKEKLPDLPENVRDALEKMKQWVCEGVDINCFQGRGLYGGGSRAHPVRGRRAGSGAVPHQRRPRCRRDGVQAGPDGSGIFGKEHGKLKREPYRMAIRFSFDEK
mgnify:CR=1 FL=1